MRYLKTTRKFYALLTRMNINAQKSVFLSISHTKHCMCHRGGGGVWDGSAGGWGWVLKTLPGLYGSSGGSSPSGYLKRGKIYGSSGGSSPSGYLKRGKGRRAGCSALAGTSWEVKGSSKNSKSTLQSSLAVSVSGGVTTSSENNDKPSIHQF